jgi:hypothetical protein
MQAGPDPLSEREHTIAAYALYRFANLPSLGTQIGELSALATSHSKVIARLARSVAASPRCRPRLSRACFREYDVLDCCRAHDVDDGPMFFTGYASYPVL